MTSTPLTAADILAATDPAVVLGEDPTSAFRLLARTWHPDINSDPLAATVFAKLLALRDRALGKTPAEVVAIAGGTLEYTYHGTSVRLTSVEQDCERAARGMRFLRARGAELYRRVVEPRAITKTTLTMAVAPEVIPMATVQRKYPDGIPQRHVAWMVSRLYELALVLRTEATSVGCAFYPEALALHPVNHGVWPLDWRFTVSSNARVTRLPGALVSLLPADKRATTQFDLACINRTALILLGDPSGIGNALVVKAKAAPTELHPDFLAWFRGAPDADPKVYYTTYRQMLKTCFGKPKYQNLEL